MAAEVEKVLGVKAELIEGSGGVFDVEVDGAVIFAKAEEGRFPEEGEVIALLRGHA